MNAPPSELDGFPAKSFKDKGSKWYIYFLYQDNQLVYIGRTQRLSGRLYAHTDYDDAWYFPTYDPSLEQRLIAKFKPPRNRFGRGEGKSWTRQTRELPIGVYQVGNRYRASVWLPKNNGNPGRNKHIGLFKTPEEAFEAYLIEIGQYSPCPRPLA